jgi:K+/H+ antiporter YhaU regulatory subunit KhtT
VVAVERGDELLTQFGSEFVFEPNDDVYVCGSSKATRVYGETFPQV